jgi:hypothetical protein
MRGIIAALLAAVLVATPVAALAQEGQAASGQPPPSDLGLSLERIRKELREAPPSASKLLRYDFHVDVYGQNPKVDFFKDFDLSPNGPVRYGGMTHSEFLNVVTPQAFRAPSADLLGLAVFALQQLGKKKDKQ